ncbi:hypothetical protein [Hyphomonas sp.]|uniref:hypothetical protein n=1 Tax=Hyphomonas sp. TaxID=87 RepID=UPI003D2932B0
MAKTPEDILKKLKPTKAFDLTPESMREFADYVIELGPAAFVARWLEYTSAKPTAKRSKPKVADPRVAELAARLTGFAKITRLKPSEAAVGFVNFSKEFDANLPAPTAAAQRGPTAAIKWLVAKSGVEATDARLTAFEERFA